jgi:hypothetical protein
MSLPSVVWMFRFYVCVYVLFYNYVQLAQSFKWKSCSHASPPRNKFTVCIVRCRNLLNTDILGQKIWRQPLKPLETTIFVHVQQHVSYHLRKYTWRNTVGRKLQGCLSALFRNLPLILYVVWKFRRSYNLTIGHWRSTDCRMPHSSTTNVTVTVDSKCPHYLTFYSKFLQSVYWRLVSCHAQRSVDL